MDPTDRILGRSPEAETTRDFARRAAAVDAPVLLTGESGTGKGLLARAIHEGSTRARKPFVAVNCAGIRESLFESHFFGHDRGAFTGAHASYRGLFEQADGGTLFLDEVAELPLPLQAKLLTALEDGEIRRLGAERTVRVHARVIAAAGCDLLLAVARRAFRRDLYHRLLVLSFHIPPLRDRGDDLDHLADHFLRHFAQRYELPLRRFDDAALDRLHRYPWPGNVRELAHAVEAAVVNCDGPRILLRHLPAAVREAGRGGYGGGAYAGTAGRGFPGGVFSGSGSAGNGLSGGDYTGRDLAGSGLPDEGFAGSGPADRGLAGGLADDGSADATLAGFGVSMTGPMAGRTRPSRYSFFGTPGEERRRILAALERCRGNKTRAAAALGMARNTLRAKLRELGLAEVVGIAGVAGAAPSGDGLVPPDAASRLAARERAARLPDENG